ncbi:MAG: PhnD/SsuA/transferrin family substrate-binding protein [Rhodospirillales bacterium]|jgi:ABC-type phosphate/phosphonate transport system substrate-binding protein|nr:PhnD/SsuA/transferrin family substrate-binding protein [Rhodospirillales bacterium]MBT4038984.1 PhnD/SsuA/transferrin family substrate-binding protein [Rhodospirillales bacterium]MBT4626656.1 PhnD/SsuA/transferrin family substrate-binding protein [Rhodospirillales bacterium]MBT5351872.1 PhnD/SsuA/transferrin family substrate-binding protein [Rhodospirillales bacterium]MBT5520640.1 PhnD/SsuA/transferrin family substrate-binding protein [Rhodospirillales bacterium]
MRAASLPMYSMPETRAARDTFWTALANNLRSHGITDVPDNLTHDMSVLNLWNDENLLISQCCGYDVVKPYKDKLLPIATPIYNSSSCVAEYYCSLVIVPEDSPFDDISQMKGTIGAINGPESHSGMSSLRQLIAGTHSGGDFFSELKVSGSHEASLHMIKSGQADVAAIDSVSLSLIKRYRPDHASGFRVLGTTYRAPAPPFVVRASMPENDVEKIRVALLETFQGPATESCREAMLLSGVVSATAADYWVMNAFEDYATNRGFGMVR